MKKIIFAITVCLFIAESSVIAQTLEELEAFTVNKIKKELSMTVISNGCTWKSDFTFEVKADTLSIFRKRRDDCKMIPEEIVLTYTFKEAGLSPDQSFILKNKTVTKNSEPGLKGTEFHTKTIPAEEYKVFADFFKTQKPNLGLTPQFFDDTYQSRRIFEKTIQAKKNDSSLSKFAQDANLLSDFQQKNKAVYIVENKFPELDIDIITQKYIDNIIKKEGFSDVPSKSLSNLVHLSRIGFNIKNNLAIFFLEHSGTVHASYYIKMQKKDEQWKIIDLTQVEMAIY